MKYSKSGVDNVNLFEIMKGIKYEVVQGADIPIRNLKSDSRYTSANDLFFCIKGFRSDGHDFIKSVVDSGAAAVVISDYQNSYIENVTYLKVENTREALAYACGNFYGKPNDSFCLAGVTGTNGKTSTTHFIEAVLSAWGKNAGLIGTVDARACGESLNIHFTTSTTPDIIDLFKMFQKMRDKNVTHIAMEVTSHALALRRVDGIVFDVGVFTNLTQDHLDFHESMDEYKEVKSKLFRSCKIGVFNADDSYCDYMMQNASCKILTYSIDKKSDLKAENLVLTSSGVSFDIEMIEGTVRFDVPIPGKFTVYNLLAAIGACASLGIPSSVIKKGLESVKGVPGRIQPIKNDKGISVIVDYSHTPDSLENILKTSREFTAGKLITVFGCGGDRDKKKRPIMGAIAESLSDYCIVTSDNPRMETPSDILNDIEAGMKKSNHEKIEDRRDAIFKAVAMAKKGDCVIIAGKGHEDYQIFSHQTIEFSDAEVAAEAIKNKPGESVG